MQPFQVLCDRVARYVQQPIGGAYASREVTQFINECYREIWDMAWWPQTITLPTLITLPANTNTFALPKNVQSVLRAYNGDATTSTSRGEIRVLAISDFVDATKLRESIYQTLVEISGFGTSGVQNDPATAQAIKVSSNSASDNSTAAIDVYVKGEDGSGEIVGESIRLNGTSAVASTKSYAKLYNVSKTANTVGEIIITDNAGTTTCATIGPFESSPQYARYRSNYTPTTNTTFTIIGKRRFVPLVDKADVTFCDMDVAIVNGAVARCWFESKELALFDVAHKRYQAALDELRRRELGEDAALEVMAPQVRA